MEDSAHPQGEEQPKPEEGGGDQPPSTEKTEDTGEAAAVQVTAEVTVEAGAKKGMAVLVTRASNSHFPFSTGAHEEVAEPDTAENPPATDVTDEVAKPEGGGTEEPAITTPKVAQTFFVENST